ncbi:hypothetical protein EMEDMD4_360013 [Sinorhizobium medicae]|uniref:Uncharacterized protein n=1 Tax=Sinorhizobium medicae TaxID=110321 RepID=A0A508X2S2_9HYPH|nr:hypothetical protein EMEDMD4_360013 [Sinorhizobium medicae]
MFMSSGKMFVSANKRGMSTGAVFAAVSLLNNGVFDPGFHPPEIIACQGGCHGQLFRRAVGASDLHKALRQAWGRGAGDCVLPRCVRRRIASEA